MYSIIPSLEDVLHWVVSPLAFVVIIGFGFGSLFPKGWIYGEKLWLWIRLGKSSAAQLIRRYAKEDYGKIIKQKEVDEGSLRSVAVIQASLIRLRDYFFKGLTGEYRDMKNNEIRDIFLKAIENLNEGWRLGLPRTILDEYMKDIMNSVNDSEISPEEKVIGQGSVSVVTYALGDMWEGNKIAFNNWEYAKKLESNGESSELRWIAAYGYFNSTMFLGEFKKAMELMGKHWNENYSNLTEVNKEELKRRLNEKLILNPILALPRHFILAAAFNEGPLYERNYFPNENAFKDYNLIKNSESNIKEEILWLDSWYEQALSICDKEFDAKAFSRNFSHAYAGFYYTLLLLEPRTPQNLDLCRKIRKAFDSIDNFAPIPSRYVKYGFYGVFHLIRGHIYHERNEEALHYLREASQFSSISGNSFADCLFMCCHALAAARVSKYNNKGLEHEVKEYLRKASNLSKKIKGKFYPRLVDITYGAICLLEGKKGEADSYFVKGSRGTVGRRIQSIFRQDQ